MVCLIPWIFLLKYLKQDLGLSETLKFNGVTFLLPVSALKYHLSHNLPKNLMGKLLYFFSA